MRARPTDVGAVVRVLASANVQFILVGDSQDGPMRVVVSRHPTNLEALGQALDRLGSSLRDTVEAGNAGARRVGDPLGTLGIRTWAGDVDLLFGGPRQSLYAETLTASEERDLDGLRVRWVDAPATMGPSPRVTSRMLGRRLMSLAEGLAHLVDRSDGEAQSDEAAGPDEDVGSDGNVIGG